MLENVPKGVWYMALGFVGGLGSILLNIPTNEEEFWRKPKFWKVFFIDCCIVFCVAIPIAYLTGTYMEESGVPKASYPVAYFASVVAKDVIKHVSSQGLPGIIAIFTRRP